MISPEAPRISLAVIRTVSPARTTDPSMIASTRSSRAIVGTGFRAVLYCMTDVREITRSPPIFARSAISCSVIPSAKYSCSGSPDRFSNGSTAMDRIWPEGVAVDQRSDPPAHHPRGKSAMIAAMRIAATHFHAAPRTGVGAAGVLDTRRPASARATTSPAVCHRSSGSLARQRRTISSTAGGTSG